MSRTRCLSNPQAVKQKFHDLDKSGDGKLDFEELPAAQVIVACVTASSFKNKQGKIAHSRSRSRCFGMPRAVLLRRGDSHLKDTVVLPRGSLGSFCSRRGSEASVLILSCDPDHLN